MLGSHSGHWAWEEENLPSDTGEKRFGLGDSVGSQTMPISEAIARENRVIFSRGEREFMAGEIIDCAVLRGEIDPLWDEFVRIGECDRLANEQGLEPDESAVDAAAIAFRYQHDLITAEETERWLETRGVSLGEFGEYFARKYWGRTYSGATQAPASSYETGAAEEKDLFLVDLILSGSLDQMAQRLSYRIAAHADENSGEEGAKEERARFLTARRITDLATWLGQFGRDEEWLNEMLAAEASYQRRVARILTEQALQKELGPLRLNLTRFELETVEVDSKDAAAEVVACSRNDGMEMSEIADEGRYPFHSSEVLLEDVPSEQQQKFLSVKAGTLFDPISRGDGFEVWRVKTRTEPSLQDVTIRARLEKRIIDRCFNELLSKYIDWKFFLPPSE
ncbi:MAG: hypothetical protein DMF15_15455 [Verrucomicrobia bacterium]|nr:MAG: hypothetical protein DMF15_15455 [Verrucomicrobiota bacterium]